ncbi:type VI secretion system-associated protein TagO [Thioclava kandeliae]|uniref:Type VI secretion system-associated protein TagO n=1 Tax=Thioclava kandeliae TaxID=3070818 RepID=A0ABV1SIS9_9RHOB
MKLSHYPLTIALLAAPISALADVADCVKITDPDERLACFDTATAEQKSEEETKPDTNAIANEETGDTGLWTVQQETSEFDDSSTVFVSIASSENTNCPYKDEPLRVTLACRENSTNAWVTFGGCFMSSLQGRGKVTYRLDSLPAVTKSFRESNNHMALGLWSGGTAIPFIKEMLGKEKLALRATPFSDSTVSGTFDIKGLDEAIKPLRAACNW